MFKPFLAINIVPTGVGANIGGYAGDAGPANKLISSCVDYLIANPNVINAATMQNLPDNLLYTEGFALDSFCKGQKALRLSKNNKIGIVFDNAIPEDVLNININAINASKSVYGLDILGYTLTDEPVGIEYSITENNISSGSIKNTRTLLSACNKMVEIGANALAIVCFFPESEDEDIYSLGQGVDPIGGIEAIISHLVASEFNLPCAHAPAFNYNEILPSTDLVDPRAASEYFSPTFMPCILAGLNKAPQLVDFDNAFKSDFIFDDVNLLISPFDCLGSIPVLCCVEKNLPIIAVRDNFTQLDVTAENLRIEDKVIVAQNYLEAAGYIMAIRNGISPDTILRPVQKTIRI